MKELNEYRILETSSQDNENMVYLHKSEEQSKLLQENQKQLL